MCSFLRYIVFVLFVAGIFSACNKIPNHAEYIPKDAVAVAGINVKGLGKKIAWNLITGSKLFKEMQNRIPEKSTKDAMNRIENAGIDPLNTFYVYVKTDTRFKGGNRITGLVPLSDASQWESYVKEVFPKAEILQKEGRKEASLGSDMYVSWNRNLLIIINVMSVSEGDGDGGSKINISSKMDDIGAEMENAFNVAKDNSILGNPRFSELQGEGHDLTFWLNYEQLMTQYSSNMTDKMGGISLSNSLWKGASFTVGFDFLQGKISGDMHYFLPDSMVDIGKEFGASNADKDMINRLPTDHMDMALTMHIAPAGIKLTLEKMGFLGLANEGLTTQGLTVDSLLGAFTGDMAVVMNDFRLGPEKMNSTAKANDNDETGDVKKVSKKVNQDGQKPEVGLSYVIKLNKKENFNAIIKIAKENGLTQFGNGFVIPIDESDSVYILFNDQYAVLSNKMPFATGYLGGNYVSQKKPDIFSAQMMTHPWAMYINMQELFKNIDPGINHSAHDSIVIVESKKLLNNISFSGGSFTNNAFDYHLDINFTNTDENSIIELMDFGMKISNN